jgi:hypothetical protein
MGCEGVIASYRPISQKEKARPDPIINLLI